MLIMLVRRECKGDGTKAWGLLNDHFASQEKPRVIMLMEHLTSLRMKEGESMSDYLIRAEDLSYNLEAAKEKISDSMLVSLVLKGLPDSYEYFKTVHNYRAETLTS